MLGGIKILQIGFLSLRRIFTVLLCQVTRGLTNHSNSFNKVQFHPIVIKCIKQKQVKLKALYTAL